RRHTIFSRDWSSDVCSSDLHGADGLAGVRLPPASRRAEPESAVAFLRRRILEHPEPVTLVALAPQTNLALLLRTHPEVVGNIAQNGRTSCRGSRTRDGCASY